MIRDRVMSPDDLRLVLGWAAEEGWNPGLDDAEAFLAADPEGFFVALDEERPVAGISVVNHSDTFAFLGLYLCRPEYRGRGIGLGLWNRAITHAGSRTIGLDGVPDQQANYARSGFILTAATTRYTGSVRGSASDLIRDATPADIGPLVALEAGASGWEKPAYLGNWFAETAQRKTLIATRSGRTFGFATVRRCRSGAKIGPLWAEDAATAHALMARADLLFAGAVTIDVPSGAPDLDRLCQALDLTPGFRTARMYRGPAQATNARLFAPASLELG